MSRTMKQDASAYRVVTKHVTTGQGRIFGPYATIGAAKSAVRKECYDWDYIDDNYYGGMQYIQTRQWFIEKTEVAWVEIPLKLVDGEWVDNGN